MNKEAHADKEIARLVRSVESQVPQDLDDRIRATAAGLRQSRGRSLVRRFWFLALAPGAAAAVLIAVLIGPALRPRPDPPISEIRTEFELVDKNIKIIFIQKPDFHLYEEDTHD
jgi:hypothetical protein